MTRRVGRVDKRATRASVVVRQTLIEDSRVSFDDAKRAFQAFLGSQRWPTDLLWLIRDRVVGYRQTYWVFRPDELAADDPSRAFYETVRQTPSSIRLDAVGRLGEQSLAYVHDYGGASRKLNFGVLTEPWIIRPVSSSVVWAYLQAASRLRGETPFLRANRFTGTLASAEELGAAWRRSSEYQ
jgi:hypothetical protein